MYLLFFIIFVVDVYKEGFEVYVFGFVNDFLVSYNYSYDLLVEYVQFIDNGYFFVDGVLIDFFFIVFEVIGKRSIIKYLDCVKYMIFFYFNLLLFLAQFVQYIIKMLVSFVKVIIYLSFYFFLRYIIICERKN